MERLYNWICWIISSSKRSVIVSKSAKVSVWWKIELSGELQWLHLWQIDVIVKVTLITSPNIFMHTQVEKEGDFSEALGPLKIQVLL